MEHAVSIRIMQALEKIVTLLGRIAASLERNERSRGGR